MSLNLERLERVVDLAGGGKQARCPACAEAGKDRKGEHLRISPEGKFGCCVFPGDREHRKRIFALAGERGPRTIKVRVASVAVGRVRQGILARLGQAVPGPEKQENGSDGSDGATAVQTEFEEIRTARTAEIESEEIAVEQSRTARTGYSLLTRNANELNSISKLKEFADPVRNVREGTVRFPHLLSDGTLVIPFSSPERYFWWQGGQSVRQTKQELMERKENDAAPF
jgi:hypothetical protein